MDIAVTEHPQHEAVVVTLTGQCDVDSVAQLQETVGALVRRRVTRIAIDLSGVAFCDSVGLSALVLAHNACAGAGGWLRLCGPNEFLTRVLDVVGLLGRIPAYATVPAALAGDPAGRIEAPTDTGLTR